jgi:choline-sulfatase
VLLLLACWNNQVQGPAIEPYAGDGQAPDVVVVTLDTTRADHLGAYGHAAAKTETIDKLAKEGIRFDQAYSPLPLTIPSHATMFTGLLPYHHHIRSNGDNLLAPEFTTLAEYLRKGGWATAGSVAAFVTSREWGLNQGFQAYFDSLPEDGERNFWHAERPGNLVVDDAISWTKTVPPEKPRFLWVHLYDAHFPYKAEAGYTGFPTPYDAEIAFVDDQIQRLVEAFEGRKVVWALIGDHGEALGEHSEATHGMWVYNATQHVPFILSGAGVIPGVVKEPVSTADLTPSILRLVGRPIPPDLDGKPQPGSVTVPYSESYQLSERFKLAPQRAVVSGNLKLVANPRPELYDVVADPDELTNLADKRPEDVARLTQLLVEKGAEPPGKSNQSLDPETLARLAALGYVAEGGGSEEDPLTFPDPKDYLDIFAGLAATEIAPPTGGPEAALAQLQAWSQRLPGSFELRQRQVTILGGLGRREEARGMLEQMAAAFPSQPRVWVSLAGRSLEDREPEQALDFARKALAADAANMSAQETEIQILYQLGRTEEAEMLALRYMESNPRNYGVAALLGRQYMNQRKLKEAERFLRVAVSATNPRRGARVQLAVLARLANVRQDAYALLQDEVKEYPANRMARRILASMLGEDQRYLEQEAQLEYLAGQDPDNVPLQVSLAQAMFNAQDYRGARRVIDKLLLQAPDEADVLFLHANLLAKEGKMDEGREVFKRADALNTERVRRQEAEKGAK